MESKTKMETKQGSLMGEMERKVKMEKRRRRKKWRVRVKMSTRRLKSRLR